MLTAEITATFEIVYPSDPDVYPDTEGGYTDPSNPWGGFRQVMPNTPGEAGYVDWAAWSAENVETLTLTLWDAALFVLDFPGAVWDHPTFTDCDPSIDYGTGESMTVTAHVRGHAAAVFELADVIDRHKLRSA